MRSPCRQWRKRLCTSTITIGSVRHCLPSKQKLTEKGMNQSELARRMAPLASNSRIGRDNVSKWVRGVVLPLLRLSFAHIHLRGWRASRRA